METHKLFPGKYFISSILEMLDYKTEMTGQMKRRYLMRAAMAGVIVGLLYIGNYTIQAGFEVETRHGPEGLLPIGKLLGSTFFGFALVFIYYSKSELLTSNMMITSIGYYFRRITGRRLRVLTLCYIGNFLGGLFVAVLAWASSIISAPTMELMEHSVDVKLAFVLDGPAGWMDLFVRAILCNFFINLAMLMVYNGAIKEDLMKALVDGRQRLRVRLPRVRALGGQHGPVHDRRAAGGHRDRPGDPEHDHLPGGQLGRRRCAHRPVLRLPQRRGPLPASAPRTGRSAGAALSAEHDQVDPHWQQWVGRCVRLGAWLAATSVIWLILLVLAWARGGHRQPGGTGPLALATAAALVDIALVGNIGRWWMTPRWPGRVRTGWLGRLTDPLGWQLPVATLVVLTVNMVLTLADRIIPLDWLSLALCIVGFGLLSAVARSTPHDVESSVRRVA